MELNNILSRKDFNDAIDAVRECCDLKNNVNKLLRTSRNSGYYEISGLVPTAIFILEKMFLDNDGWIMYFCDDLNFGREWEPGMFLTGYGKDLPLKTTDDLYDLLLSNMRKKGIIIE